jgi:predicted hydrolase (HD superfamily)
VEAASVRKKLKDKAFARGVSRDDVFKGAEELGVPVEEHFAFCIAAMRAAASELGLNGVAAAPNSTAAS